MNAGPTTINAIPIMIDGRPLSAGDLMPGQIVRVSFSKDMKECNMKIDHNTIYHLLKKIDAFLNSRADTRYIKTRFAAIRLIKDERYFNRVLRSCIIVESIRVKESRRQEGIFHHVFTHLELRGHNVYVERILNPICGAALKRRGYHKTLWKGVHCMYKRRSS